MLAACEAGDVFALLESGTGEALEALSALYAGVREPWLTRALLHYHARTGSARALDLLARAPAPHAQHLLAELAEQLRGPEPARAAALAALAPLVARRPAWLHRLPAHPLARELLRAARQEPGARAALLALLALAALLPGAPALGAAHAPELAEALLRAAPAPPHLLRARRALFRALYATHPCTLLHALRTAAAVLPPAAAQRAVAELAAGVRLHPALVTGSRRAEADPSRWARVDYHDVVAECRRLSLHERAEEPAPSPLTLPPAPAPPASPPPGSGAHAARALASLRPGAETWFALADRCGADSAPPTPLPADADAAEPPEAAVEATPENTPARETRAQFRFPSDSNAVRAIGRHSRPTSPPRKETSPSTAPGEAYAGRLARVAQERRAADSPVPFAGAPPPPDAGVARPEPSRPTPPDVGALEPLNVEDREVIELTRAAHSAWAGAVRTPAPRRGRQKARRSAPAPRRARSCAAGAGARHVDVAVQTVETWPEPYEFIMADLFQAAPEDSQKNCESVGPCERLDEYLSELYAGRSGTAAGAGELGEQLALAHASLMYERWRRDAHAERNRRLLGRCRQERALELRNQALQERVRALERERDELRARPAPPAPAPAPAPAALQRAHDQERAARLRAEALLREADAQRALLAADLQRARADAFDAARHGEALARAALAAERRAEQVRRLRRELLVLGEREARLARAARAPPPAPPDERALRAALARAEAEAEAATARAEAGSARAHELEAALAAREAQVCELKRGARAAAAESAARARALSDKYSALLRILRAQDSRALERLATAT